MANQCSTFRHLIVTKDMSEVKQKDKYWLQIIFENVLRSRETVRFERDWWCDVIDTKTQQIMGKEYQEI